MTNETDLTTLSFEDALKQLEAIVGRLERGDVPLDESIELYAQGDRLRVHCETRLRAAQARIEKITMNGAGTPTGAVPFDAA